MGKAHRAMACLPRRGLHAVPDPVKLALVLCLEQRERVHLVVARHVVADAVPELRVKVVALQRQLQERPVFLQRCLYLFCSRISHHVVRELEVCEARAFRHALR